MAKDALSKMIAVHNFHNSLELFLRTVLLHLDIRTEKTMDIGFENMLSEIDKWCKENQKEGLRYRQNLRNLNQKRNHVQHDATEPELSTMETWRVYTRDFLEQSFQQFFGRDFNNFSREDSIDDPLLRLLVKKSREEFGNQQFEKSAVYSKIAFESAAIAIERLNPKIGIRYPSGGFWSIQSSMASAHLVQIIQERVRKTEMYALLLSLGVGGHDYKRYVDSTHVVLLREDGTLLFYNERQVDFVADSTAWILDVTVDWILLWQTSGIDLSILEPLVTGIEKAVNNGIDLNTGESK
jgi:hypothetical protein